MIEIKTKPRDQINYRVICVFEASIREGFGYSLYHDVRINTHGDIRWVLVAPLDTYRELIIGNMKKEGRYFNEIIEEETV
jgi:hypothetical protein